jgi:UDP-N-acetylmuramate dehydrogenase
VVVWAQLELALGDRAASEAEIAEIVRWRRENQPGGQNAGSVFTNPPGDSAGRLIDQAGLKGHRVGSAHVSTKHANFIQADEGGSADDVHALILEVQRLVEERTGVRVEPELRLIGFDPPSTSGSELGMET